jgi:sn-glycerol 3-phosphate transport system substrate-binding protein
VLEQFSSRHNLPLGTQGNGRAGLNAELNFNTPLHQRTVQTLVDMQKDKSFDYGGRSNDAAAKFISGECAILTQSSGGLGAIARDAKFALGTAPPPVWPDVKGAPFATTIGGASLWLFSTSKHSATEHRGVAQFLNYLRSTPVMSDWAKQTGLLPATRTSFKAMQEDGCLAKNPRRDVPILSLTSVPTDEHTNGYRFGRWTEIRDA